VRSFSKLMTCSEPSKVTSGVLFLHNEYAPIVTPLVDTVRQEGQPHNAKPSHMPVSRNDVSTPAVLPGIDAHTTLVIYMGLSTLPEVSRRLVSAGLRPDIPAVAIERGTLPEQRAVFAPLQVPIRNPNVGGTATMWLALSLRPHSRGETHPSRRLSRAANQSCMLSSWHVMDVQ